jgi:predicted DNA binding CopG/RHH family protein
MKAKKAPRDMKFNDRDMKLDDYEKQILEDYRAGKFVTVEMTPERKKELRDIATYTTESREGSVPINIRLPAQDLIQLRERAEKEGLPYQTLARSILHRYVTGQLADLNHVQTFAGTVFEKLSREERPREERNAPKESSPSNLSGHSKDRKTKSA